jgi:hypothetical protein
MKPFPFAYPKAPLTRRHGPVYEKHWEPYRDWLRDEFGFRCVYCLRRERWIGRFANFDIDHIISRESGGAALNYGNLAYACHRCNLAKGKKQVPHPDKIAYGGCVKLDDEGNIRGLDREGRLLVRSVRLDEPEINRLRKDELQYLRNLFRHEPEKFRERMSDPDDLPDLRSRKPDTNSNPDSWKTSAHARKAKADGGR